VRGSGNTTAGPEHPTPHPGGVSSIVVEHVTDQAFWAACFIGRVYRTVGAASAGMSPAIDSCARHQERTRDLRPCANERP